MVNEPAGTLIITTPAELLNSEVSGLDDPILAGSGLRHRLIGTRRCEGMLDRAAVKDVSDQHA
jgi:hypothetical protein